MARIGEELDAPVLPQWWRRWPPAAVGGLLLKVQWGGVVVAATVVVAEAVGLEAFQSLLPGVRPTPASLRSSSSWI